MSLVGFDRVIRARGGGLPVKGGPELGMEIAWPVPPDKLTLRAGVISAPGPVDGLPRLFAFRRVGNYPLVVAIGLAEEEVFAAADAWEADHKVWGYGIILLLLSATGVLAWSLRRQSQYRKELELEAEHLAESKQSLERTYERQKVLLEDLRLRDERLQFVNTSLRLLNDIATLHAPNLSDRIGAALKIGCEHLGLELGIMSHVVGQDYIVEQCCAPPDHPLHSNKLFELGKTYCDITLNSRSVVAIARMGTSEFAGHPCYSEFGLETYIGVPLVVNGEIYGTVNFSSAAPYHRQFDEGDSEFMRLLGRWAGAAIADERISGELRRLATTDPLTGVWNRRQFLDMARRELERSRRYRRQLSAIMLDIDHFKKINDMFGHAAGDEALVAVVHACQGVLRDSDLFARFGGEEFVVLLPETTASDAFEVAERLRSSAASIALPHPAGTIRLSISVGIAEVDVPHGLERALIRADEALYVAKQSGRNRCQAAGR